MLLNSLINKVISSKFYTDIFSLTNFIFISDSNKVKSLNESFLINIVDSIQYNNQVILIDNYSEYSTNISFINLFKQKLYTIIIEKSKNIRKFKNEIYADTNYIYLNDYLLKIKFENTFVYQYVNSIKFVKPIFNKFNIRYTLYNNNIYLSLVNNNTDYNYVINEDNEIITTKNILHDITVKKFKNYVYNITSYNSTNFKYYTNEFIYIAKNINSNYSIIVDIFIYNNVTLYKVFKDNKITITSNSNNLYIINILER